jgi:hypothetical protein
MLADARRRIRLPAPIFYPLALTALIGKFFAPCVLSLPAFWFWQAHAHDAWIFTSLVASLAIVVWLCVRWFRMETHRYRAEHTISLDTLLVAFGALFWFILITIVAIFFDPVAP